MSSGFGLVSFYCFCCRSVSGCVWVCVCPVQDAPLYIPVQTGVGVWFSRLSPDECIFCLWFPNKSVAVPFFSRDVEWSLPPSLSLPCPVSPVSPVVVADPDVFGTTLKFLLEKKIQNNKIQKKKTLKIIKKKINHPPENIC